MYIKMKYYNEMINIYYDIYILQILIFAYFLHIIKEMIIIIKKDVEEMIKNIYIYMKLEGEIMNCKNITYYSSLIILRIEKR